MSAADTLSSAGVSRPGAGHPAGVAVRDLRVSLGRRPVLHGVDLTFAPGTLTGVVGPNGSGKTTLLRAVFRGVRPDAGAVYVDGKDVAGLRGRELARSVAAAVQEPGHPAGMSVREVVELGRYPHHGDLGRTTAADRDAVRDAAATTGIVHLLDRDLGQLSGGERQRVHVARAIAQGSGVLLLDEPTNHLDIAHQFSLLSTLRELTTRRGTTVALALHDLAHAARFCDTVVVLAEGNLCAFGSPEEVFTPDLTRRVFGVDAHWDGTGRLLLEPIS